MSEPRRSQREPMTPVPFTNREILRHLGTVVKRHRRARGLKRPALAVMIGRSLSWVERVEQGKLQPDYAQLLHLAVLLKIPLRTFFPSLVPSVADDIEVLLQTSPPDVLDVVRELLRIYRVRGVGAAVAATPISCLHCAQELA